MSDNYYLLAALPSQDELDSVPETTIREVLSHAGESGSVRILLETLFLSDDLIQRQGILSGEIETLELNVLTEEQVRGEEELPDYLVSSGDSAEIDIDILWHNYFKYAFGIAERYSCEFLAAWIGYEVAMKNALVLARAKSLGIDPIEHLIAVELGDDTVDFAPVISEWTAAPDPLAGLRCLDNARWKWLGENDSWFSFKDDEMVAFSAKLILQQRWQRLSTGNAKD